MSLTEKNRLVVAESVGFKEFMLDNDIYNDGYFRALVTKIAGVSRKNFDTRKWCEFEYCKFLEDFNDSLSTNSVSDLEVMCYELITGGSSGCG